MNELLLNKLSAITPEEKEILEGKAALNRSLYYASDSSKEIDSARVLENGKLIDIRPHTRFIHFPRHTHNYVEFVYMVRGTTTHIIDGETVILHEGDLLFMNQHATQEILPAREEDIAVNFMILPAFFNEPFNMISLENSPLREFIISCLSGQNSGSNYIFFEAKGIVPIENLLENLIWNLLEDEPNRRSMNQTTMGLLLMSIINHSEKITISDQSFDQQLTLEALRYIESSYTSATLTAYSEYRNMDIYTVSRIIKKQTGKTFKQLLEEKRLEQTVFLLKNTHLSVEEIARNVGYENISFFYRLFNKAYHTTPREYRLSLRQNESADKE